MEDKGEKLYEALVKAVTELDPGSVKYMIPWDEMDIVQHKVYNRTAQLFQEGL